MKNFIWSQLIQEVKGYQSTFRLLSTGAKTGLQQLFLPENLDGVGLICKGRVETLPLIHLAASLEKKSFLLQNQGKKIYS